MDFADQLLVHLSDPDNLKEFLTDLELGTFLTADFQTRFESSEFWEVAQVKVDLTQPRTSFEQALWVDTRILGREEHHGDFNHKTNVDYKVYGHETALWTDMIVDLNTTWLVDQFPGSVITSEDAPSSGDGEPVRPAQRTVSNGATADYRFKFTLRPVDNEQLELKFLTRLHLSAKSEFNLIEDLRSVLRIRRELEQRHDYLLSLNDTSVQQRRGERAQASQARTIDPHGSDDVRVENKRPHAFALVYKDDALTNTSLDPEEVRRFGDQIGVLISFFAIPE